MSNRIKLFASHFRLIFKKDTDRASRTAIKLQNATTVLTDPNPTNTFICLPLTEMAADDDLDDTVNISNPCV